MYFSIREEFSTVSSIRISLLSLDDSGQKFCFCLLPTKKIKHGSEIREFDMELYEAGDVCLFLFGVYSGTVRFEVEQYRQSKRLLHIHFEFFICEQLRMTVLDERNDLRFAILLMGLRKNRHQNCILRQILGVSVRIAIF